MEITKDNLIKKYGNYEVVEIVLKKNNSLIAITPKLSTTPQKNMWGSLTPIKSGLVRWGVR